MAERDTPLSKAPIDKVVGPFERFLHIEAASGVVLLLCAVVALVLANTGARDAFLDLWRTKLTVGLGSFEMSHSLKHWINDGLMAVFFFVIGLEVKREVVLGELRGMRRAALPVFAALGGMVVPAGLYLALQWGEPAQDGWGIPMATDIAFVVGCMAVMSKRIPSTLRVLLLSIAIADDIGAILVIAIGYTDEIRWGALGLGGIGLGVVYLCNRLGVRSFLIYIVLGSLSWVGFHESGVHATILGVALGLMTPTKRGLDETMLGSVFGRTTAILQGEGWAKAGHRSDKIRGVQRAAREVLSPLEYLEGTLHPWVGFVIMPVFALANAGVTFELGDFAEPGALAIAFGLVVGKPLGIVAFSWVAVRAGIASLPSGITWGVLAAGGFLAGIGFTMALFIADLALAKDALDTAKVGILGASALAAAVGMVLLFIQLKPGAGEANA